MFWVPISILKILLYDGHPSLPENPMCLKRKGYRLRRRAASPKQARHSVARKRDEADEAAVFLVDSNCKDLRSMTGRQSTCNVAYAF